jgi:SAM-dependent methyltransferase
VKRTWNIRQIEREVIPANEQELYAQLSGTEAGGYVDFYEKRQDAIIKRDPATFEKLNRVWQFEYLRKHGLKKSDRFLDYGCGPAAAGIHFIEYLDEGRWVGVDISSESIRVGQDLVRRKKLDAKKPRLIHIPHGDLAPLGNEQFEVILAQSVFTHLPPDAIIEILQRLHPHFAESGRFFSSFSCCPEGIVQQQLHNWYYDRAFIQTAAAEAGLKVEFLDDWKHPYQGNMPSFAKSTLACFALA